MIDEIHTHDYETFYYAVVAAESNLVLTSFRSFGGAGWTLQKLVDSAPADQRDILLGRLARVIRGILWQDLVPVTDSLERKSIMEIMFNTPKIATLIRKRDFAAIEAKIEKTDGMVTMRQSVLTWQDRLMMTTEVVKILDTVGTVSFLLLA